MSLAAERRFGRGDPEYEGEKLVKRVLGHSDYSVTSIYNRYGYVRDMRRALEQ